MNADRALNAERKGRLVEAAKLYEEALEVGQLPLWGLINLVVLYWQATDYGFWTCRNLPRDFVERAGHRLKPLLERASVLFPESTEVRFWRKYIAWTDWGGAFDLAECRGLMEQNPDNLIPGFHLFAQSNGTTYRTEALRLLDEYKNLGTVKGEYVKSVIEGVLRRTKKPRASAE